MAATSLLVSSCFCGMITAKAESLAVTTNLARQAVAEGIVMLKNEDNVLPINSAKPVSYFGRCQSDTFVCGYGSGTTDFTCTNIMSGIKNNPALSYNEELYEIYNEWRTYNPVDNGTWGNWPYYYEEMPLTEKIVGNAREVSDLAVVVIGRAAGEDRECVLEKGSYYLTDAEIEMLDLVTAKFEDVIVLLNVGNLIDMAWVDDYSNVKGILYIWQGGKEMGNGVADVLSGEVTPSGKLTDTIANSYDCYPTSENFGTNDGNTATEIYYEDIYVGYRYFETFAKEDVKYPFGFGLSYTDFETTANVTHNSTDIKVSVTVKNIGESYSGKEVIQVYYSAPQGKLGKPARELAAYAKTNEIAPGDSQTLEISFPISSMASYDDSGVTGHDSAWVLEAGEYKIYVGNSVRAAELSGSYILNSLKVVEQLEEASAPHLEFDRLVAKEDSTGNLVESTEKVPTATVELPDRVIENLPNALKITGDKGIKLIDVAKGKKTMDEFVAQLSVEELAALSRGYFLQTVTIVVNHRNGGALGGMTQSLRDKGVPAVSTHDGPAVTRFSYTDNSSTTVPIGTMLACTWNDKLIEQLYHYRGVEMVNAIADIALAPGLNIHRDPLCGRNFEYFSEDPLLSGQMAAKAIIGLQSAGAAATPKHYMANNQEVGRRGSNSVVSERAQREIYLKSFEIAVKSGKPYYLMASYNRVNGEYSHYNYELHTTILREQWGYEGAVMSDWHLQPDSSAELGGVSNNAYRVRAQVDINMPGAGPDVVNGALSDTDAPLLSSYNTWINNGSPINTLSGITLGELQRGAKNVLGAVMNSVVFRAQNGMPNTYEKGEDAFQVEGILEEKKALLESITIEGIEFGAFDPNNMLYHVFYKDIDTNAPTVYATAENGASVSVVQATPDSPMAVITVIKDGGKTVYRVVFSNKAGYEPVTRNPVYAYAEDIKVNGISLPSFYPTVYNYSLDIIIDGAEVTADTPEGVDYQIITDTEEEKVTVRTVSDDQALEYVIAFKSRDIAYPSSDTFDGNAINTDIWQVQKQNSNLSVSGGTANIVTEYGGWKLTGVNQINNLLYQEAEGDWIATVDMVIENPSLIANTNNNYFGMYVFDDTDNYVAIGYETQQYTHTKQFVNACQELEGSYSRTPVLGTFDRFNERTTPLTLSFRIQRTENTYNMYYQCDEITGTNYNLLKTYTDIEFTEPKIGLLASFIPASNSIASSPSIVKFDNFDVQTSAEDLRSDDFSGGKLGPSWNVLNRNDNLTLADSSVNIQTQSGEWYASGEASYPISNVLYQNAFGDWTVTVDVVISNPTSTKGKDSNQFMLTVFDDTNNFIDIGYFTASWRSQFVWARQELDGKQTTIGSADLNASNGIADGKEAMLQLRIKKSGNEYTTSYKTSTMSDFGLLGTKVVELGAPKIGLYASYGKGSAEFSSLVKFKNFTVTDYNPLDTNSTQLVAKTPIDISASKETKLFAASDAYYYSSGVKAIPCSDSVVGDGNCLSDATFGNYAIFGINVEKSGYYNIYNRVANGEDELTVQMLEHCLELDGNFMSSYIMNPTGGWQSWVDTSVKTLYLSKGFHRLRFLWKSNMNLNYISLSPATEEESNNQLTLDAKALIDSVSESYWNTADLGNVTGEQMKTVICEKVNALLLEKEVFADFDVSVTENDISVSSYNSADYSISKPLNGLFKFSITLKVGNNLSVSNTRNGIILAGPSRDINNDKNVDIIDLVRMKKVLAENEESASTPDLNSDGNVNSKDIALLKKTLLDK